MPTSYYGQISSVLDETARINPRSILDIGVGFGKYGMLCREMLDITYQRYEKESWQIRIDGIEGYSGYRTPVHDYVYNNLYYALIEDTIGSLAFHYDLGLMIDVLEHFEKKAGDEILHTARKRCDVLLVSVPASPSVQSYLDNGLEQHRSVWLPADFISKGVLKVRIVPMGFNNSCIIALLGGI